MRRVPEPSQFAEITNRAAVGGQGGNVHSWDVERATRERAVGRVRRWLVDASLVDSQRSGRMSKIIASFRAMPSPACLHCLHSRTVAVLAVLLWTAVRGCCNSVVAHLYFHLMRVIGLAGVALALDLWGHIRRLALWETDCISKRRIIHP